MKEHNNSIRKNNFSGLLLNVFSGLTAAMGTLLLIMFIGSAQAVPGYTWIFQLVGIEEMSGLILRPLQSALITLGVVLFVLMLAMAALLFSVGRLVKRQLSLAERVRILEEQADSAGSQ